VTIFSKQSRRVHWFSAILIAAVKMAQPLRLTRNVVWRIIGSEQ
jgi:hypothetical protein